MSEEMKKGKKNGFLSFLIHRERSFRDCARGEKRRGEGERRLISTSRTGTDEGKGGGKVFFGMAFAEKSIVRQSFLGEKGKKKRGQ